MTRSPTPSPYCPHCGQALAHYRQYNAWFCDRCWTYVNPYFPLVGQPPVAHPTEDLAKGKIFHTFRQRGESDRPVSVSWVPALLVVQTALVITALAAVFFTLDDIYTRTNLLDFSMSGYTLLLVVLSFILLVIQAIMAATLVYWLVGRRDRHFERDALLRQGMVDYLISQANDRRLDINVDIWTMNTISQGAYPEERARSASMWALFTALLAMMPGIGLIMLMYILHFLTRDTIVHHDRQATFNHHFHAALARMGEQPLASGYWKPLPRRSTGLYIALTILTAGFFLPYWWYVSIKDMNDHFTSQRGFEDELVLRLGGIGVVSEARPGMSSGPLSGPPGIHRDIERGV